MKAEFNIKQKINQTLVNGGRLENLMDERKEQKLLDENSNTKIAI